LGSTILAAPVNFSPMSPKLVRTYPHIVENWGITMASLFLRLKSLIFNEKVLPVNKNKLNSQSICEKVKLDQDINPKNNGTIVIHWFFYYMWISSDEFW
jgi:hypothetical protein